ncbi:uncharacterized protein LOC117209457 [Bombus bifarius]|uniref:Uncharacterized protein LOC117209457 n=1 Tax=Bombus bifarius TaxID=103933 RepID=A0A6P8MCQ1_9HYME|nr:uncharacterized protein LOC117209457 [Bombus bifarius]
MIGKIVLILSALALARAQIPSLGFCPDYVPMANFDMSKFLGIWYEAERYFQLTEVVSRCVMANYTMGPDGKYRVSNEVTNRFTGIKRVLEGEIKKAASKAEEGKLIVKYTIPLTPETKYSVLETDYDSYAVLWSCSGIGPFHTQNAWVMTRERLAPGTVLQKAYAVLDSYKISKTFFVKTDQQDCAYLDTPKPLETSEIQGDQAPVEAPQKDTENVRAAVVPDAPEVIVEMNTKEDEKLTKKSQTAENAKKKAVNTVPVRIMEVADAVKEDIPTKNAKIKEEKNDEPMKEGVDENMKQTMLRIYLLLIIASVAIAQVPFLGSCPTVETIQNFDMERYLGKWYEIEKYFAFFEFGGKCVTATYNITDDSNSINILNKQISALTGVSSSIEGVGKPVLKVEDAKLTVSFPSMPLPLDAPYWILDTDYTTYSVVWSCSNFGVFSTRNVWIMAREPKPLVSVLEKAYQILDKNNISRAYFIRTDQKNCPIGN